MLGVAVVAVVLALLRNPDVRMTPKMRRDRVAWDLACGVIYLRQGQPAQARPYFEDALRLDPRSHLCHSMLVYTALMQGDDGEAYQHLGQAIDAARDANVKGMTVPKLYSGRAMVLVRLSRERESEAVRFCRQALDDVRMARASGGGSSSVRHS